MSNILCSHCSKYANLGRVCTKDTHFECDCPKCQGMCYCGSGWNIDPKLYNKVLRDMEEHERKYPAWTTFLGKHE